MEYRFKIQLKGISRPGVWRRVVVPGDFTFLRFHRVIQTLFGWEDYHLFEFKDRECQGHLRITEPRDDDSRFGVEALDASKALLSLIFADGAAHRFQYLYVYDFGDRWVHNMTLEAVPDPEQERACCLSGNGSCPPEDCGGPRGYGSMKDIFRTMPESKEADEYRNWLGLSGSESWDADAFDIDGVNAGLKRV